MKHIPFNIRKTNTIRWIFIIMLLGWMVLIYIKSNEPYKDQDIRPFLTDLIPQTFLNSWLPHLEFYYSGDLLTWKEPYILLEFFFRKSAHVTEYAILTALWIGTLRYTTVNKYKWLLSPILAILYAASDEWHQSFVLGRTGHAIDMAVDSIGILLVMLVWLASKWRNRKKEY
jgi:VanZ family protein